MCLSGHERSRSECSKYATRGKIMPITLGIITRMYVLFTTTLPGAPYQ